MQIVSAFSCKKLYKNNSTKMRKNFCF